MNYPNTKQKTALCFLALGIISLFFIFVYKTTGIYFETNDDRAIAEILSGALSAKPDAHVSHLNYFLTLPLAGLYTLTKQVPWYGLCLILFQGLAYFLVLISLYFKCRHKRDVLLSTAIFTAILFSNVILLGTIQFTSTAILMATAGWICLLLENTSACLWIELCRNCRMVISSAKRTLSLARHTPAIYLFHRILPLPVTLKSYSFWGKFCSVSICKPVFI